MERQVYERWLFCCLLFGFVFVLMLGELLAGLEYFRSALRYVMLASSWWSIITVTSLALLYFLITLLKTRSRSWQPGFALTPRETARTVLVVLSLWVYAAGFHDHSEPRLFDISHCMSVVVFITGILFGQIIDARIMRAGHDVFSFNRVSILFFLLFLAIASGVHEDFPYKYSEVTRWIGLWTNPNTFGLLMATGLILAFGLAILRTIWRPWLKALFCLIAAGLLGLGLLHSYSRGAWMAFGCGFLYLGCRAAPFAGNSAAGIFRWFRRNGLPVIVVLCSAGLVLFWQLYGAEHPIVRRLLSVGNANDFSWRNRVAAWQGSSVMIADRPLSGFGWGLSTATFNAYYRPAKMEEGGAVQTNDFYMIGSTLGLPALGCFLWFVGLSFKSSRWDDKTPYDWSRAICRAGALVLLIGFWFDGGLFKMATAVPFWILLELGAARDHKTPEVHQISAPAT